MRSMIRVCLACFLMLLIVSATEAQINPVYQKMMQNGWRYPFGDGFRKLTASEVDTEFCRSMGYDDTTVANLKKMGVNVMERWKPSVVWDEKAWAALSDCIVIGTVLRIEHPFARNFWYHTVAYVQVEEFLRNDYGLPKGQVAVLEVSGPTGQPGESVEQIGEDTLSIGEHVLLFLSASSLITFAANNNLHDLYNYLINDSTIRFRMLAKYDIRSGQVFSKRGKRTLSDAENEINKVLKTAHRSLSTDK